MRTTRLAFGLVGLFGLSLANAIPAGAQGTTYTTIERGRYLVNAGDCASCHTDQGGKPYAGGLAVPTPFGVIYSTNITPDPATGIGKWSEQDFYKAMHNGIGRDGKHLYPAFPYPWFTKVSRDDVGAIKAFLDTLTPVRQANKPTELHWPLNVREVMAGWNELYFHEGAFKPDPTKSEQWNRGAYLVEGLGHCGACHTATNELGAPKAGETLKGGDFGEHWYAPSLTSGLRDRPRRVVGSRDCRVSQDRCERQISRCRPDGRSYQELNPVSQRCRFERRCGVSERFPVGKVKATTTTDINKQALSRGEALYFDNCTGCHMENGEGLAQAFPPLKGSSAVQAKTPDTVIHVVLAGAKIAATKGKPTGFAMPAFDWKLDDKEVADLVNYIRNAWGNHASLTSADTVSKVRRDVEHGGG